VADSEWLAPCAEMAFFVLDSAMVHGDCITLETVGVRGMVVVGLYPCTWGSYSVLK